MDKGPLWDETKRVVGCAMEVLNQLGHGMLEKPYENALAVELSRQRVGFRQQPRFEVEYKGTKVGEYVPDLVVFDRMIVDAKVVEHLSEQEYGQMLNYLRITNMRVGLLLNFRHPRLQWKRVIL